MQTFGRNHADGTACQAQRRPEVENDEWDCSTAGSTFVRGVVVMHCDRELSIANIS